VTPEDDSSRPEATSHAPSPDRGEPRLPRGVEVVWTEEERRLLSDLETGGRGDATEAIRRLVLGILGQVREASPEKAGSGPSGSES